MKLKGNYDITESGIYIVIFEDEKEWEVEFYIWIDKKYNYEIDLSGNKSSVKDKIKKSLKKIGINLSYQNYIKI